MGRLLVYVGLLALSDCASSSGVYQVAPYTFQITTSAITSFGGEGTAKAKAVDVANVKCADLGRHAEIVDSKADAQFTQASTTITFKCVNN